MGSLRRSRFGVLTAGLAVLGAVANACGGDDTKDPTATSAGGDASTTPSGDAGSTSVPTDSGTGGTDGTDGTDAAPLPPGADRKTATIGPSGGTLVSADGKLTLTIPAGALAAETELWVESTDKTRLGPEWSPLIAATTVTLSGYELGPTGTTFAVPAKAVLDKGIDTTKSIPIDVLITSSNGKLEKVEKSTITVATDGKRTLEGAISHFSPIINARESGDAHFEYSASGPETTDFEVPFTILYKITPISPASVKSDELIYNFTHYTPPPEIALTSPAKGSLASLGGADHGFTGSYFCSDPVGTTDLPTSVGAISTFVGKTGSTIDAILAINPIVFVEIKVPHTCKPKPVPIEVESIVGSGRVKAESTVPGLGGATTQVIDCTENGGTCKGSTGYHYGVAWYATPSQGWVFEQWSSATDPLTFPESLPSYLYFLDHPPLEKLRTVKATFTQAANISIAFAGTGGGYVRDVLDPHKIDCHSSAPLPANCILPLKHDESMSFTATANDDSVFAGFSGASTTGNVKAGAPGTTTVLTATFNKVTVVDPRTGDYTGQLQKKTDFYTHDPFVWNCGAGGKTVTLHTEVNGSNCTISAVSPFSPSPWLTLNGTIDGSNVCTASASGTIAGYNNVPVAATCTFTAGTSSWSCPSIKVGDDNGNSLPQGSITYQWGGTK
ncbi:MAG: hypothetical protein U0270_16635 [Labilithrix sp.]